MRCETRIVSQAHKNIPQVTYDTIPVSLKIEFICGFSVLWDVFKGSTLPEKQEINLLVKPNEVQTVILTCFHS